LARLTGSICEHRKVTPLLSPSRASIAGNFHKFRD
jgi:hypothetical protein